MDDHTSIVSINRATGLGSIHPDVPPEYAGSISSFGFPAVMKRTHKSLVACINRIPHNTNDGQMPLREAFLKCLALGLSDQALVDELSTKIGMGTAREDLLQKRISKMTSVDYISTVKEWDTPDGLSVSQVRNELLRDDRERFAQVNPGKDGNAVNEWDFMDETPGM